MLTSRFLRFMSAYLYTTSRVFYAVPFRVSKKGASHFHLEMQTDPKAIFLFTLNFSFQCETVTWSFLRLCQMHLMGEYDTIHPYVIHAFNMVGFGYPAYLQIFLMAYGDSYCSYINQAMWNDHHLRKKYWSREKRRQMDLLETGASVLIPLVYVQSLCFGMYSLMKPTKPFFHCSLLRQLGWSKWAQLPVKIYECYMFINCWHVIVSTWVILLASAYSTVRWATELLQNKPPGRPFSTVDDIRLVSNSLPSYRTLYMLTARFNQLCKVWVVGIAFYTGKFVAVYMGFASIKLGIEQTIPITEYLAYPTSCLFLLILQCFASPEGEKWHTYSSLYIRQLKYHPKREVKKMVRALLPMAATIFDFFQVRRGFGVETTQDAAMEIGDLVISVG